MILWNYARTLIVTPGATLADQREAVATLEDTERIARRVLGGTHPVTTVIEKNLKEARSTLAANAAPLASRRAGRERGFNRISLVETLIQV